VRRSPISIETWLTGEWEKTRSPGMGTDPEIRAGAPYCAEDERG